MDPNPLVQGKGIEMLKKSGIEVTTDILKDYCQSLNEPYFKYMTKKKPYITLKIAQTIDGKIATDQCHSRWITSESSRRFVHRLRKENDAVLVGVNTIVVDDSELTVRMVRGNGPKRIILDRSLAIPLDARVLHHPDRQNTIIVTTSVAQSEKIKRLNEMGITIWSVKSTPVGSIHFSSLWKKMIQSGIISVLVEGGKEVFTSFLRTGEVDRVIIFIAPKFFGQGLSAIGDLGIHRPDKALQLKEISWVRKGSDMMLEGWF
jgi:diaminohydroxyphosphoribosylaminopyrimidine deaminase/5-amino-6-(5-phosphoribosylamino)uracil reductase